jgi:hypothetical protein
MGIPFRQANPIAFLRGLFGKTGGDRRKRPPRNGNHGGSTGRVIRIVEQKQPETDSDEHDKDIEGKLFFHFELNRVMIYQMIVIGTIKKDVENFVEITSPIVYNFIINQEFLNGS